MAYAGTPLTLEGATLKLGGTEVQLGGTVKVAATEKEQMEELICFGNYPNPTETQVRKYVEGDVEAILAQGAAIPACGSTTTIALVADTFALSGNIRITDPAVDLDTSKRLQTIKFGFKTTDENYTYQNA